MLADKYINPFTDFGFKKLFGEEPSKDLLMDFLNEVLREDEGKIKSLTYLKTDHLGATDLDRRAIFDLYCENEKGEKFIVELQKTKQKYFKDRSLYYATFPIQEQAKKGDWSFKLERVYTIAILDFVFDDDKGDPPDKFMYRVKLTELDTQRVFYDKLTFVYFAMPRFNKTVDELETHFDKWLYVLKNLHTLTDRPAKLQERIFDILFERAQIAAFTKEQLHAYQQSLKYYRDIKNSIDTSFEEGRAEGRIEGRIEGRAEGRIEGRAEGRIEGRIETAEKMKAMGVELDTIVSTTGLTRDEIENL